jgi:hypothetical protein
LTSPAAGARVAWTDGETEEREREPGLATVGLGEETKGRRRLA